MKRRIIALFVVFVVCELLPSAAFAVDVRLHINPRWKQCSFQLDSSLTQDAWHQFTQEAGLVAYFRTLTDARPMGVGKFEISVLQWETAIDETDHAWNDTFVHVDSTHWLIDGPRLAFPGLTVRAGVSRKIDLAAYWAKRFDANYGFWAGQVQYNLIHDLERHWAAASRLNVSSLYGPKDLTMHILGLDLLASRDIAVHSDWVSLSPYAIVSSYLSHAHERTAAVNLDDEQVLGVQGALGAVANVSIVRLAVEYNLAKVNSLSYKIGFNFRAFQPR